MIKYILLLLFVPTICFSSEFHLIELDEARIDYISFFPGGRDAFITSNGLENRELGKMLDLNINTTLAKYGYWRSLVHSYTDSYRNTHASGQFRSVGLNMEIGIKATSFLDIFVWHYSQHLLDTTFQHGGFPVQDGVGIHIYLFSKERKGSIF